MGEMARLDFSGGGPVHQASKCQEHLSHQQPELRTEQLRPRRLREPGATSRGIGKVAVGSTTCKIQSRLVKIQLRSLAQEEEDEEAQTIGALFLSRLLRRNV